METSALLQSVYNHLVNNFPDDWINKMSWEDSEKDINNVSLGLNKIKEARQVVFDKFSRFALGGKQFIEGYDILDKISEWALCDVFVEGISEYKEKLEHIYSDFLLEVQDSVNLLRYHIDTTGNLNSNK